MSVCIKENRHIFCNMSTEVQLKFKSTEATVDCLFSYEMCFHRSKHIMRYTLHVSLGNVHELRDIL